MTLPVRFSHLRAYGRSAAHGNYARTIGIIDPSYAMERGTAVHALLFDTRKVCGYPGKARYGKEYEKFAAERQDCEILTMTEYDKARRMADAARASTLAAPYLQGVCEQTIHFRWMGVDCRSTPDVRGGDYLTEVKTSSSAEPEKFTWHALRMAYHAQMRMEQIASGGQKQCFIVCIESDPPHPVTVFQIDKRTLELGEKLLVLWMERLKASEAAGQFPPYTQMVWPLSAPEELELDYEAA